MTQDAGRTYQEKLMGWTSPYGDTVIQLWWLTTGEIQLREIHPNPADSEYRMFPGTEDGYLAARIEARMRAELITVLQPR
jgi:hypothetical protein